MCNPSTGKICETRDVIWLRRMFYERQDTEETMQEPVVVLELEQDQEETEDRESETGNGSDSDDDNTYSDVWKKVRFPEDSEARESENTSEPGTRTRYGRISVVLRLCMNQLVERRCMWQAEMKSRHVQPTKIITHVCKKSKPVK